MTYIITQIEPQHDQAICRVIKSVGAEIGAIGAGFGPSDPEVQCMSRHYGNGDGSIYYVALAPGEVIGGGGISAFNGSREVCELRKLFLLPQYRRRGIGEALAGKCLAYAKACGYARCYLDTLLSMQAAISLYKKLGFQQLAAPLEGSGHTGCDIGMLKNLCAG